MSEHFISLDDAEKDLLACAAFLAERIKSVDGRAEAIAAIVPQYLAKGEVDLAAELSNTVDDPFARDRLLTAVAVKCAEIDDNDYALQLADSVEEPGMRMQALERVALARAEKGSFDDARSIASELPHFDGVLANIAVKQAAGGLETDAAATIEEIEYPGAAVTALHDLAVQSLKLGDAEKAVVHLEHALDKANEIEHEEEKARAYCDVGNAFIEAGRNDRAIAVYDLAKSTLEPIDNMHRDVLLAMAAQGLLRAGSVDLADRTLDLVTDKTQIASCLLGYSREFWRKDERTEAIESLEEAYAMLESQHERETRDSRARFLLFTQIAAQFAGFEMGERAIEIAERIHDVTERTAALSQVAAILSLRNEDEEARHAFRAIDDDGDRALALVGMSDAKEKNGDRPAALELLIEAAELAEAVPQLTFRASAYNEIARRLKAFGETGRAREIVGKSLGTIAQIRDPSARVMGIASLARSVGDDFLDENEEVLRRLVMQQA
jgi:tetratricopeptide (TPR) repeat protein